MSEKKIGFWKWLWQWSLKTPCNLKKGAKSFYNFQKDEPIVESIVGLFGCSFCWLHAFSYPFLAFSTRIGLGAFSIFFVLMSFHGFYRGEVEDC